MRIHKDGFIQCRSMEFTLTPCQCRSAMASYPYRNQGFTAEIEKAHGIRVEHIDEARMVRVTMNGDVLVKLRADWRQPTRA